MNRTFTIEVEGLAKVLKKIEKYEKDVADRIDKELEMGAHNVANDARTSAPNGRSGKLASLIDVDVAERFLKTISVNAPYGAYVEFGTGVKVFQGSYNFSAEQKRFARRFYVTGRGKMPSNAFLFPALDREKPLLIQRIKRAFFGKL